MDFKEIIYTKEEGIATITLNRPEVLNALSPNMLDEWVAAIESAKNDSDVRVLVVTGAGRGFCSGADVKRVATRDGSLPVMQRDQTHKGIQRIPLALESFNKPYIASVNGPCVGGGFDQASMADIRIASDKATFTINHLRMGGVSRDGGYYYLTRILGLTKTLELVLTYKFFDAQEALRLGYVSMVVPHGELTAATREMAAQLAKGPPLAMQFAKRLIYQSQDVSLPKHLEDVERTYLLNESTEDFKEGPRALIEKRPAQFKGR
ncbi:enoyl-CoA hydratase/isomerase family protein [Chloroflexota bacterium]